MNKKKAWEMSRELFLQAQPVIRSAEEQTWDDNLDVSVFYDRILALDWGQQRSGQWPGQRKLRG